MNVRKITKNAIIIALYLVMIQLNPIGWGSLQFRIGEICAVIPFYNREYVPALVIGAGIANLNSPLGIIDVIVGVACCAITYAITKNIINNYIKGFIYALVSAGIVSLELLYVYNLPYLLSFIAIALSMAMIMVIGVTIVDRNKYIKKMIID